MPCRQLIFVHMGMCPFVIHTAKLQCMHNPTISLRRPIIPRSWPSIESFYTGQTSDGSYGRGRRSYVWIVEGAEYVETEEFGWGELFTGGDGICVLMG